MDINICKQPNSSITEDLDTISLGKYTVLAGENNAGKSNIIKALKTSDELSSFEIIEISAEKNDPGDDETSTSVQGAQFYKMVKKILDPIFNINFADNLLKEFEESSLKKEFLDTVNSNLKKLGVNDKELDIQISKEDLKDSIIIKIIKAIVKDLYKTEIQYVDINNIGMGTKRLIITALIQYYQKNKISPNKKTLIIIEEPEIYLHPKLKKSLHEALLELSKNENIFILITTHDSYFIELTNKQIIYKVSRDSNRNDCTCVKKETNSILEYESDSEKNYFIFGIPTKTYFLELYEYLLSFVEDSGSICKECNKKESRMTILNKFIFEKIEGGFINIERDNKQPAISKLRHSIAHPNENISDIELEKRIKEVISVIELYKK